MKAYILAVVLHIYVDMTNSIVCLKAAQGLQDSSSLSARANMGPVGIWAELGENIMGVFLFFVSHFVQSKRTVIEENLTPF